MTIRDLEIFIAVAQLGKMGLAAKKLYISQPTVSHVISQIESDYNIKLFDRLSRKLYITETGREFLQYAKHIMANFEEMEHYMRRASEQMTIHVGASLTVGSFFLANMINQYEHENNNVKIRVYIDNSQNIIQKISGGELDIAIIEGNVNAKDVIKKEIYRDEMVLICGKKHPFAQKKSVKLAELADMDCVMREEGSGTRAFLLSLTEESGIHIVQKWVCHSSDSIINIVASGQGVSIVSKSLLIHEPNIVQIPIKDKVLSREFRVIYHKDKYLSKELRKYIAAVEKYFKAVSLHR
ncbi:LysR family transcriptional regulator [Pectinatus frisingensis]|jgi:DNA-binding transcriptional LysR family regulator|uniref:LysR family transcriptional regulator n=1 Tax=Pectinatus frisingensis TaxID=865 RepID=UPI0015F4EBF0|nr:LysR family transcriptional regulator [Pectinatus frisingensis]